MSNGKGSKRRPRLVSQDKWEQNYNRIFRKQNGKCNKSERK
jgi:hypothetical protein